MVKSASMKWTKASTYKPNGKPLPRDITIDLDPATHFYEIENDYKTK